jgi:hypothetical protein
MGLYEVSPDCGFNELRRAWLILIRAACNCGHVTRPCLTADGAANALFRHQAQAGTRVA